MVQRLYKFIKVVLEAILGPNLLECVLVVIVTKKGTTDVVVLFLRRKTMERRKFSSCR